jgi:epoxyqueuosine reductase
VSKLKAKLPQDPFLVQLAEEFNLPKMLEMSDQFYEKTVHPIMYNYIKDKKYFQRNAAIALGNTGDPDHIPLLEGAMEESEVESRLKQERSNFVKEEIEAALAN